MGKPEEAVEEPEAAAEPVAEEAVEEPEAVVEPVAEEVVEEPEEKKSEDEKS